MSKIIILNGSAMYVAKVTTDLVGAVSLTVTTSVSDARLYHDGSEVHDAHIITTAYPSLKVSFEYKK